MEIKEVAEYILPNYNEALRNPQVDKIREEIQVIFEREQLSGIQAAAVVFPLIAYSVKMISQGDPNHEATVLKALSVILGATRVNLFDCCLRMRQGDGKGHSLDCSTQRQKEVNDERRDTQS